MIYLNAPQFPMTYLMLCFKGGAQLDPIGQEGLSVICLRQLLNGTRHRARDEFTGAVERLGSELSLVAQPQYLALSVPALTEALPELTPLLREALCEPALSDEEIERAVRTYAAELEATWDDDGYLAWQWLSRRLFEGHPLWRRASLTPNKVRAITPELVRAHWGQLFVREALLPCVSGSATRDEMEALLAPLYAQLPSRAEQGEQGEQGEPQALAPLPELTARAEGRLTLVSKADRRQAQVLLAQPGLSHTHPEVWAFRLGVAALGGTFSSPLMQEVRVKRGLSYGASATLRSEGACATLTLNTTPEGKDALQTLEVMFEVLERAKREGLTADEIEHARQYLINAHPFRLETPAMRASLMARATLQGVPVEHELEQPRFLREVSVEEVNAALARHLTPQAMEAVVLSAPEQLSSLAEAQRTGSLAERFSVLSEVSADDPPSA